MKFASKNKFYNNAKKLYLPERKHLSFQKSRIFIGFGAIIIAGVLLYKNFNDYKKNKDLKRL